MEILTESSTLVPSASANPKYRTFVKMNHVLSFTGGSDKLAYASSLSYYNQDGIVAKGYSNFDHPVQQYVTSIIEEVIDVNRLLKVLKGKATVLSDLSTTEINALPESDTISFISVAPASTAFSSNSFTALLGR